MDSFVRKFLASRIHAQAITKRILKKKGAGGNTGSRTCFKFSVSFAPEERTVAIRNVHISSGRFCF